jgi:hypothetical protein
LGPAKGDKAKAYEVIGGRIANYARENKISKAVVKGSAVSKGGMGLSHLQSAEVRGAVMASLAGVTLVELETKGNISRHFGKRKADDYVADDSFWKKEASGTLRKGSREAALLILAARK